MTTAKKAATSMADRIKANKARALASANKKVENLSLADATEQAAAATKRGEASCRVFAFAMAYAFGEDWDLWDIREATTDNEKATREAVMKAKRDLRDACIDKGCTNVNKAWSDAKKCQREARNPFGETRDPKPLTQRVKASALAMYKAIGKADITGLPEGQQTKLLDAQRAFGTVLVAFGEDLSAINAKL